MTDIVTDVKTQDWYKALITELDACIVETSFSARDAIIQGKHFIGKEILAHEEQFSEAGYLKASELIAQDLGKSQRDIEQCIQFARKYPDLSLLPQGKAISWHIITRDLLPEHTPETLESKSKPITKSDLIQILKDIKTLLKHELETEQSEYVAYQSTEDEIDLIKTQEKINCIRYLQDQIEKIEQGVK